MPNQFASIRYQTCQATYHHLDGQKNMKTMNSVDGSSLHLKEWSLRYDEINNNQNSLLGKYIANFCEKSLQPRNHLHGSHIVPTTTEPSTQARLPCESSSWTNVLNMLTDIVFIYFTVAHLFIGRHSYYQLDFLLFKCHYIIAHFS